MKTRYDDFGKALRQARQDCQYSQERLRKELERQGILVKSKGTISKWENGDSMPHEYIVEALEDALGVKTGTLLRPARYGRETPGERSAIDPLQVKRREQHFDDMADILRVFVANRLHSVTMAPPRESQGEKYEYAEDGQYVRRADLTLKLDQNVNRAMKRFGAQAIMDLMYHLAAELPGTKPEDVLGLADTDPYRLIAKMSVLARRKLFKGKCRVCSEWA